MEAELTALAAAGANSLVQLIVGDAWAATRSRVRALFGRSGPAAAQAVEAELDQTRVELLAATDDGEADGTLAEIEAHWQARLLLLLRDEPAAADALRALIAHAEQPGTTTVQNTVSGGDIRGPVIQTGTINGDLHFG
ncbi:hypothetical protein [Streptomyces sp. NBC_01190]|uniref:hypothetical protein n=1 Tax=Streptomyces sp. NBC_01190 TaxID=2903767 RepID=UPI003869A723|nr:hypothetical protein OG519_17675 [Streptomyces sp. NBC_01190]